MTEAKESQANPKKKEKREPHPIFAPILAMIAPKAEPKEEQK